MQDPAAEAFQFPELPAGFGTNPAERAVIVRFLAELEQLWLTDTPPSARERQTSARERQRWLIDCRSTLWMSVQRNPWVRSAPPSTSSYPDSPSSSSNPRPSYSDPSYSGSSRPSSYYADAPTTSPAARASSGWPDERSERSSRTPSRPDDTRSTVARRRSHERLFADARMFEWAGLPLEDLPVCRRLEPMAWQDALDNVRGRIQLTCLFLPYQRALQAIQTLTPGVVLNDPTQAFDPAGLLDEMTAFAFYNDVKAVLARIDKLGDSPLGRALLLMVDSALLAFSAAHAVPDLIWYESRMPGVSLGQDGVRNKVVQRLVTRVNDLFKRLHDPESSLAKDLVLVDEVVRSVVPGGFRESEQPSTDRNWWAVDTWWKQRLAAQAVTIEAALGGRPVHCPEVWCRLISRDPAVSTRECVTPVGVPIQDDLAGRVLAVLRLGVSAATGDAHGAVGARVLLGGGSY